MSNNTKLVFITFLLILTTGITQIAYCYTDLSNISLTEGVINWHGSQHLYQTWNDGCWEKTDEVDDGKYTIIEKRDPSPYNLPFWIQEGHHSIFNRINGGPCYRPPQSFDISGSLGSGYVDYLPISLENKVDILTGYLSGTVSINADQQYSFKVDCVNRKVQYIELRACFPASGVAFNQSFLNSNNDVCGDVTNINVNGIAPAINSVSKELVWILPPHACGESFIITPTYSGSNYAIRGQFRKIAAILCPAIEINSYPDVFEPSMQYLKFQVGAEGMDWTLVVAGRTFKGSGSTSVWWNGKDENGNLVPSGVYTATLSGQTSDGKCNDTKSIQITVKSSCNLKITDFYGSSKLIDPTAGGKIDLSGSIFDNSGKPINWTMNVVDTTFTGAGTAPSATWTGKNAIGKVIEPGKYSATLTATTDDSKCSDSKTINFDVVPSPDGQCGLYVDFGSSANVASGALTQSQELSAAKGGFLPLAMGLSYNSLDGHAGSLGTGWSHSYDIFLKTTANGSMLLHEGDGKRKLYTLTNGSYASQPGDQATLVKNADGTFTLTKREGTAYRFGTDGKIVTITDRNGNAVSFTYSGGNLVSVTDPAGRRAIFTYDAANHLSSITDPAGNAYLFTVSGTLTTITNPDGGQWRYTYDADAFMLTKTDPLGNTTTYAYDANHRAATATDPEGKVRSVTYDAKGNLASKTDGNGNTIRYTYDGNGKLLKKSYPDGTEETYTYDVRGNILTATNQHMGYSFTYDAAGKVTKITDSTGKAISYEYDALGNKTKTVTPDGRTITYSYDKGRLAGILDGATFAFGYDSLGRRASLVYPNGDMTTYGYDKDGQLATLVQKNAKGTIITSNSYTLDKISNRLSNTTQDRSTSYTYDAIYRLTQALSSTPGYSANSTGKGGGIPNATQQQKEFYTYDAVGNRLSSDKTNVYVYNQGNQLVINGGTYSYDRNGNLTQKVTSDGTTTYTWDYEDRLVKVSTPTTTSEYAYDPFGRRIEKKVTENGATTTTRYFYDGQAILFEYDDSGTIGNRYTHGPNIDEPLMLTTGKDKYYYHADGLGSIIALTDQAGKVVQAYEYDSFGNLKDQKNRVKQPYAYTGREWDRETGLYYYRARYYDPMEGRFISKDLISFAGGDVNLYGYAQNNPINNTDPSGLISTDFNPGSLTNMGNRPMPGTPTGNVTPGNLPNAAALLNGTNNNLTEYAQRQADAAAERAIDAVERTMDCGTTADYTIIYGKFPIRFIDLEPVGQYSLTTQNIRRVPRTLRGMRGCICR